MLGVRGPIRWSLSPDGTVLAVTGTIADHPMLCTIDVAQIKRRSCVAIPGDPSHYARNVSVSTHGKRAALTFGPSNGPGSILVMDPSSGAVLASHSNVGLIGVSRIHLSPDGTMLVWERGSASQWQIAAL